MNHRYDAIIVGAGGAGLMAALTLCRSARVAVISKLYPARSHTGAAQGGIGAALGNLEEDHWQWHMFDTVKGSDYLADQDAVEILCREAIETVYELEHWGLPFSRTTDGRIAQRTFGGHTRQCGKAPVRRSCYSADRTGHMILQTLYQQCIQQQVDFYNEFFLLDLLVDEGRSAGAVAMSLATGEIHVFHAKAVLLATGGCGRVYSITSNAHAVTGDGMAAALRAGIPLEDMEFYQFHPTGILKLGILLSEAARGEGGVLRNRAGERFMEKYAPTLQDLAPRDMVSRAMYREIRAGRGIDGRNFLHLDLTHLGADVIESKLPDISGFVRTYLGIDPVKEPIPVQPTAHYMMGGIPTDVLARVVVDPQNTVLPGLYAAGECACVSVHGGNRLGTNSLVDILVFGRRGARHAAQFIADSPWPALPPEAGEASRQRVAQLRTAAGQERPGAVLHDLQEMMFADVGIFRTAAQLTAARDAVAALRQRYGQIRLDDRGLTYNTELQLALELGGMLDLADVMVHGALARQESRGAHFREDFPTRDDANWLKHTLASRSADGGVKLAYKPVTITQFQPQERKY
jgi:succinate dehydrogenase / fumarate reductase flavoprotein subunit